MVTYNDTGKLVAWTRGEGAYSRTYICLLMAVEGFGEWALVQKQDGVNNYTPEAANTKDLRGIEE